MTNYPSTAVPPAHPARLAAFSILHGLRADFCGRFSYLELGCGDGSNLLPIAAQFPEARLLGVDRDAAAVGRGEELRRAAGLDNVALHAADLCDHPFEDERFDYVVAHGVYSWVAPEVQRRLLAVASKQLAPDGVLYLSYNTLPGWGVRGVVRDLMRAAAGHAQDDAARLRAGKAAVARAQRHMLGEGHPWGVLLGGELTLAQNKHDGLLLGEYLAEHNEPVYFTDLVERVSAHGLRFMAETLPATTDGALEAAVLEDAAVSGMSRVEAEQQLDLAAYRQLRGSLFCHAGASSSAHPEHRGFAQRGDFAARLTPSETEPPLGPGQRLTFRTAASAVIQVERPLTKAALLVLSRAWPAGLPARTLLLAAESELQQRGLLDDAPVTAEDVESTLENLVLLSRHRQIEILPWTPRPARAPGVMPLAPILCRLEAARRVAVTTPLHVPQPLEEPTRTVLELSDGTRDLGGLARELGAWVDSGGIDLPQERREALARWDARLAQVRASLARLCELGLLVEAPHA